MAVEGPRPVRNPNYYFGETPNNVPTWEGNGARILGIHGHQVDQATFLNLYAGYTTRDGQRDMRLPRYMRDDRRGALEMTFNNPKCSSLLRELAGDTRIAEVDERAVTAAMKEVERQTYVRHPWQQPNNLIYTRFGHSGSREDDAHSHTHVTIMNLSHAKSWKAIELGYLDLPKIAAVYRDTKMTGLRECGYKLKRSGAEYEIVGVPAEVKARFSRRHGQVKELEADYEQRKGAPLTTKAKSRLSVFDRPEKPDDRPIEERRAEWRERLSDGERDGLHALVANAEMTVDFERWQGGLKRHDSLLRQAAMTQDMPEREISRGYSR